MSNTSGDLYTFGSYRLDATRRVLTRSGAAVTLAPKTFDLLVVLTESGGRLLTKRELMEAIWKDTFVEEANLSFQISTLRKALGDEGIAWIEAVPKYGYRFKAPLEPWRAIEETQTDIVQPQLAQQAAPRIRAYSRRFWLIVAAVAGAVAVAAAFLIWMRLPNSRKQGAGAALAAFPVTSYRGRETNPSFSPDGGQIAFAWEGEEGNNFDIYVKAVGENSALRLTSDPRPEYSPGWSPDGRRIAFCRDGLTGTEIVLVSALGGPERILANLPKQGDDQHARGPLSSAQGVIYPDSQLAWFPDGLFLAVVGRNQSDGPNTIFLLSTEDGEMRPLTSPSHPSWGDGSPSVSPDGHFLAFTRSVAEYPQPASPYVVKLSDQKTASGEPRRVTTEVISVWGLAWTSDGHRLVYGSKGALWSIGLDHNIPESLSFPGLKPRYPVTSTKGDRLAFVHSTEDRDIWRIGGPIGTARSANARGAPTRLISSTQLDTNPQYSEDGRRIAFTSSRSGTQQIWACNADGSNPVQLTELDRMVEPGTPRASPDGRYIAFDATKSGMVHVFVVSAQGGPVHRLTTDSSHEDIASWSHDGKWIYFESDRSGAFEIWKVPFASGTAVQVTTNGGAEAFESRDGRFVYYSKWERRGLWRRPVTGGPETLVMESGSPFHWGLFDKGACLVDSSADAGPTIKCLDLDSNQVKTVCTLRKGIRINGNGPSFAVSPDGRWILYVGVDPQESDIMVVNNFR